MAWPIQFHQVEDHAHIYELRTAYGPGRRIIARFESECSACGHIIKPGDLVLWAQSQNGVIHAYAPTCLRAWNKDQIDKIQFAKDAEKADATLRQQLIKIGYWTDEAA